MNGLKLILRVLGHRGRIQTKDEWKRARVLLHGHRLKERIGSTLKINPDLANAGHLTARLSAFELRKCEVGLWSLIFI